MPDNIDWDGLRAKYTAIQQGLPPPRFIPVGDEEVEGGTLLNICYY